MHSDAPPGRASSVFQQCVSNLGCNVTLGGVPSPSKEPLVQRTTSEWTETPPRKPILEWDDNDPQYRHGKLPIAR